MIIQISPNQWVNIVQLQSIEIQQCGDEFFLLIQDATRTYAYQTANFNSVEVARSFAKSIVTKLGG